MIEFVNVGKKYSGGVWGVKNVNLKIHKGEFVSIIGPSGSGKSTLLRIVNQLNKLSTGKLYFRGNEISSCSKKILRQERQKMGMFFQNYNLVSSLSVIQNVLHGRLGYKNFFEGVFNLYKQSEKERALEILREMGLAEFSNNYVGNLSGGQKQRVGIARAIMQEPEILLCDEPIASLDPVSAVHIMDTLQSLNQKGLTCLVNLHQVEIAKKYSSRIIGLNQGEVVFDGTPCELNEEALCEIYKKQNINVPKEVEFSPIPAEENRVCWASNLQNEIF